MRKIPWIELTKERVNMSDPHKTISTNLKIDILNRVTVFTSAPTKKEYKSYTIVIEINISLQIA